jgi:hypothetical protein
VNIEAMNLNLAIHQLVNVAYRANGGIGITDVEILRPMRMSVEEYRAYEDKRKPKAPKYGNKKKIVNGLEFDSTKEARRWQDLVLMQQAGQIVGLERQREYPLDVNGLHICTYVADFSYRAVRGADVIPTVEDVKSEPTRKKRDYVIKRKLMLAIHGIAIKEI